MRFIGKSANYGRAVFVDDNTYYATCTNLGAECFLQVLALYHEHFSIPLETGVSLSFEQNQACVQGSSLMVCLTDVQFSPFAETDNLDTEGITYFNTVSTDDSLASVSSYPIKICQCISSHTF